MTVVAFIAGGAIIAGSLYLMWKVIKELSNAPDIRTHNRADRLPPRSTNRRKRGI